MTADGLKATFGWNARVRHPGHNPKALSLILRWSEGSRCDGQGGTAARYIVLYTVEGNRRLTGQAVPYHVLFPDRTVLSLVLSGRRGQDPAGTPLPGFSIEASGEAVSADAAIARFGPLVELFVYCMVLARPGRYERPRVDLVMPFAGPGGEFIETYEVPQPPRPSEEIDLVAVAAAYGALMGAPEEQKGMWRLEHAGGWLSRGLNAGDRAARMSFVYTGLDVLDDLLKAAGFDKRGGQSHGIAGWLAAQDPTLEERARKARNDVVHGNSPIMDMQERLADVDHELTAALRGAIWQLLGQEAPPWEPDALDSGVPYLTHFGMGT